MFVRRASLWTRRRVLTAASRATTATIGSVMSWATAVTRSTGPTMVASPRSTTAIVTIRVVQRARSSQPEASTGRKAMAPRVACLGAASSASETASSMSTQSVEKMAPSGHPANAWGPSRSGQSRRFARCGSIKYYMYAISFRR